MDELPMSADVVNAGGSKSATSPCKHKAANRVEARVLHRKSPKKAEAPYRVIVSTDEHGVSSRRQTNLCPFPDRRGKKTWGRKTSERTASSAQRRPTNLFGMENALISKQAHMSTKTRETTAAASISGVTIPSSKLAREATELVRDTESSLLF